MAEKIINENDWQDYEDELLEDALKQNTRVKHKTKKSQKESKYVKSRSTKEKFAYRKKDGKSPSNHPNKI